MNLYNLYSTPAQLIGYEQANNVVSDLVWDIAYSGKKLNATQIQTLAKSPKYAYYYARDIIKGRFQEGEAAIAGNAYYAYLYARDIIKGRWPEGEKAIASSANFACAYAIDIIKGRFPECEKAIASDAYYAYGYATDII